MSIQNNLPEVREEMKSVILKKFLKIEKTAKKKIIKRVRIKLFLSYLLVK